MAMSTGQTPKPHESRGPNSINRTSRARHSGPWVDVNRRNPNDDERFDQSKTQSITRRSA
jgi:hypothetical protein